MKKASAIAEELVPEVIAQMILEELEQEPDCRVEDQPRLIAHLLQRTEEIAAANESFRRKLRGGQGREWLYSFMRHWLAAELQRTQPAVFRHLPPRFAMGAPAPRRPRKPERAFLLETSG